MSPATATVVLLSLIGGLRSFELIWATTGGGPGFASDVLGSVIYKNYQAGFYGLSTAGNVVLFVVVTAIIVPINIFLNRREVQVMKRERTLGWVVGIVAILAVDRGVPDPVRVHLPHRGQDRGRRRRSSTSRWPTSGMLWDNIQTVLTVRNFVVLRAFINSTTLTVFSVGIMVVLSAMMGYVLQRRKSRWNPLINFLVLAGLIVPPAVVPTIWVLQEHRAVQADAGHDLGQRGLRACRSASCCSAPSSPPSRRSWTRRPSWMGPDRCGCSSPSSCRCSSRW